VDVDEQDRFVLDSMDPPGGTLQLIAFRENGAIQIGVADGTGHLLADIAVHGTSIPYEPYAWRDRGWAIAFGGVPPDAVRAEIRDDDGEVFRARILPFPPSSRRRTERRGG
jgi:hypothetical protein